MKYEIIDFNDTTVKIIGSIESNSSKASLVSQEIRRLKKTNVERQRSSIKKEEVKKEKSKSSISDEQVEFEDTVEFYLDDYKELSYDFTIDDLIDILPDNNDYYYDNIILRFQAESIKTIKEYSELLDTDKKSLTKEDFEEIKNIIETEKRKINCLKEIRKGKLKNTKKKQKNKIIIIPGNNGNYKIIDDLKKIDETYYDRFNEILKSIEDGSFKRVKRFKNNNVLSGLCEVRAHQVRIPFIRLSKDTYGIFTAFTKKTDNDKGYRDFVVGRYTEAKQVLPKIKELVNDEEFQELNDLFVKEVFDLLQGEKNNEKIK